jgi:hypothetical protein
MNFPPAGTPKSISYLRIIACLAVVVVALAVVRNILRSSGRVQNSVAEGEHSASEGMQDAPNDTALESHPLAPALALAREVEKNIQDNVRDYTATLIKQERVGNELKPQEICYIKVRNHPLSVYMKFLAPENLKGQEVIYVEGANEGKLIGHAGSGVMALAGSKWLDPKGPLAMLGQRYPITELGLANLVRRLIEVGQHDEQFGECDVWRNDDAKVGDRACIAFTVVHPEKRRGFLFHIARIFIDKELMVPLRYEAYDWPAKPGDPPPLLESYTYARLKLNSGLTDADFDPNNPEYNFFPKK